MAVRIQRGSEFMQMPVIPLIDTFINLLIFFLVATRVAEAEREIEMKLPDASEAVPVTSKPNEMIINIDHQGHYFVSNRLLTLPQLDQVLVSASRKYESRPPSVVFRADKRCEWEHVVAAMNSCRKAKIRDYRVTTRDPREGAG